MGEDTHDKVRGLPLAYGQADTFFREGIIKQYCDGKCGPF